MTFKEKTIAAFSSITEPLVCFWGATTEQLDEAYGAYTGLWSSSTNEDQARDVYDSLVAIALTDDKLCPLDWILRELRFEAFVAATGDRKWSALMELEHSVDEVNDQELDLYNERIMREL